MILSCQKFSDRLNKKESAEWENLAKASSGQKVLWHGSWGISLMVNRRSEDINILKWNWTQKVNIYGYREYLEMLFVPKHYPEKYTLCLEFPLTNSSASFDMWVFLGAPVHTASKLYICNVRLLVSGDLAWDLVLSLMCCSLFSMFWGSEMRKQSPASSKVAISTHKYNIVQIKA